MMLTPARGARRWIGVAVGAVLLLGSGGAQASSAGPDPLPTGTVTVDGQKTPILGTFVYHQFNTDTNPEIRGFVHGVRRVKGATVLYYSIGTASGGATSTFTGSMGFPTSMAPYKLIHAVDIELIDAPALAGYRPLSQDETFTSSILDLDSAAGDLRVGFAVFPALPAETTTVDVVMPWGAVVGDVPVEDGALTPVGKEPAPLLGKGWPALPSTAGVTDPTVDTYTLIRRTGDVTGAAETVESPEQVSTTLDANVLFASSSADLSGAANEALATVAADIAARGTGEVVITGHTDSDGADAGNQVLSEQRAAAVLAVLQPASGTKVTFVSVGKGEAEPVASNSTDEGKQQNRRVTVVYAVKGDS